MAKVDCTQCNNNHRVKCPRCEGTGIAKISKDGQYKKCFYCKGDKEVKCPRCSGTGKAFKVNRKDSFWYTAGRYLVLLVMPIVLGAISYLCLDQLSSHGLKGISGMPISADKIPNLFAMMAFITSLASTLWAIQSYWRLRDIDKQTREWEPIEQEHDSWLNPFSFHELAESHKEWAELWFCWCVAIFLNGVTYAIFSIGMHHSTIIETQSAKDNLEWPTAIYNIISTQAPSGFIYLLFGVAWFWASKHYKSHWHNFVVNAYRHRALHRFAELQKDIDDRIAEEQYNNPDRAHETILELYRLSGVLLLIPGDSSYLDKIGTDEISKSLLQLEEATKVFTHTAMP